jgi:hypothetical protein
MKNFNEIDSILGVLKDNLSDLEKWSADNDDEYNSEISNIKGIITAIEEQEDYELESYQVAYGELAYV